MEDSKQALAPASKWRFLKAEFKDLLPRGISAATSTDQMSRDIFHYHTDRKWFILYVKSGFESKVAKKLAGKSIECFCPSTTIRREIGSLSTLVHSPLFPSYIFVRTHELQVRELRKLSYVAGIMHWLQSPVKVTESEMEDLKTFMLTHTNVRAEKYSSPGFQQQKSFASFKGNLENAVSDDGSGSLYLASMGYMLIGNIAQNNIRKAKKESANTHQLKTVRAESTSI